MKNIIVLIILAIVGLGAFLVSTQSETPESTSVTYTQESTPFYCPDDLMVEIQFATDPTYARLMTGERSYELQRVESTSGARYENKTRSVQFWESQNEAMVSLPGSSEMIRCQSDPQAMTDIVVAEPVAGEILTSPISLVGEARGYWFFEASAPVELIDGNGEIIAQSYITATGDWMTEAMVPFSGTLEYSLSSTTTSPQPAILRLKRDNPSGLTENDGMVEVSVSLL